MMNEFNPDGKDIRFIDSHYRDLFRIPDGGTIQVHYSDDSVVIKPCKFIDGALQQMKEQLEEDETELLDLTNSVLQKLSDMDDEVFEKLSLSLDL